MELAVFNRSRLIVLGGPRPARLMEPLWGGVSGVGAVVLCTSQSNNAQLHTS